MHHEIIIAGYGGQGILLMGRLLAHAGMLGEKNVTCFPSYGAEIRGGTANCTVVVSEEAIASPLSAHPDVLIAMNEASMRRFEGRIKSGGLIFINSSLVKSAPERTDIEIIDLPASELAAKIGNSKTSNIVMLGAFIEKTAIITVENTLDALREMLPDGKESLFNINREALFVGTEWTKKGKGWG
ncbi:MAG: 2-oxoacid:acceptor oxidoreductase family protein [Nitrospirota bacterium]